MGALKGWHIVVLLIVVLLLFGAPKLPELARSIGKSLHILKEEAKSLTADDDEPKPSAPPAAPAPSAQAQNDAANTSTTDVSGEATTGNTEARDK
jgi:sec-independent protein translocase protein TatA